MLASERVCLLLADVSGYTAYLAASEPDRAPALAADLVETVVRRLRPAFRLVKLEGDAAFMVGSLDRLDGGVLVDTLRSTVAAFQGRVRSLAQATTCTCAACRRVPELDLKFVVHVGSVVRQRVLGRTELAGTAAIVAHRLLKASSPRELGLVRYALLTDACVEALGIDASGLGLRRTTERFDFLGDVGVQLLDLADASGTVEPAWMPPRGRPILSADLHVPLSPGALFDELTSPVRRATWEGFEAIDEVATDGDLGVGTVTACVVDRLQTVEHIVEWRPFEAFARTVKLPDGRLTARHELRGDDDGTRLSVTWWGGAAAVRHAERARARLEQLGRRDAHR